jgi:hypothetical protein
MQLFRHSFSSRNCRRLYAVGFLLLLLCEAGSHAVLGGHVHYDESTRTAAAVPVHSDHHGDQDCDLYISCDEDLKQDSDPQVVQDDSSHHDVLVPSDLFSFIPNPKVVGTINSVSVVNGLASRGTPFLPPKQA